MSESVHPILGEAVSATEHRPAARDALCQSKSARLLHNSSNKLYNTNPPQIEVTKSELFG